MRWSELACRLLVPGYVPARAAADNRGVVRLLPICSAVSSGSDQTRWPLRSAEGLQSIEQTLGKA